MAVDDLTLKDGKGVASDAGAAGGGGTTDGGTGYPLEDGVAFLRHGDGDGDGDGGGGGCSSQVSFFFLAVPWWHAASVGLRALCSPEHARCSCPPTLGPFFR